MNLSRIVKIGVDIEVGEREIKEAIQQADIITRIRLIKQLLTGLGRDELKELVEFIPSASESFNDELKKFTKLYQSVYAEVLSSTPEIVVIGEVVKASDLESNESA